MKRALEMCARNNIRKVFVLTGSGVSAESGIPTFRGPDGYWRVGSRDYHPQELATVEAFTRVPRDVWAWYLYRRGVCNRAAPNPAHEAIARLERNIGAGRFTLATQTVDGLHLRAGNSPARTFEITGNINHAKCTVCKVAPWNLDTCNVPSLVNEADMTDDIMNLLKCPQCKGMARPHVLGMDEMGIPYHSEEIMMRAAEADLMIVVGTSGSVSLSWRAVELCVENNGMIIDVNVESNPYEDIASRCHDEYAGGAVVRDSASRALPALLEVIV
jgi:NAD-dependent deacetylase